MLAEFKTFDTAVKYKYTIKTEAILLNLEINYLLSEIAIWICEAK